MKAIKESLLHKVKELFGIDGRSLAIMRIGFALLILADLFNRSRYLKAHYTDAGLLPREALFQIESFRIFYSLHLLDGSFSFEVFLFVIAAVFAFMLLVGYKTRLVTIVSWILLVSLHSRNLLVLQGGDVLFRVALFWAMFLPWGNYFSIDRALKPDKKFPHHVATFATAAYLMQIALVYLFIALHRSWPVWLVDRTAVYLALSIDQFTTKIGLIIYQFPALLEFLSVYVIILEAISIFILFSPIATKALRTIMLILLITLQIGFGINMQLGLFPWISVIVLFGFITNLLWDPLLARLKTKERLGFHIYYDDDCGFCKKI